jgi:hypothetical protein
MLGLALLIAILLLLAAGIGAGIYLIGWPSRVVDPAYSPGWRATFFVILRLAGAVMVSIGLLLLYMVYWLAKDGPGD